MNPELKTNEEAVLTFPTGLNQTEFREWMACVHKDMLAVEGTITRHTENDMHKLKHTFTPGLYTREMFLAGGTVAISRVHMFEHPFIVLQGRVSVYDGNSVTEITAPFQGVTSPGTQRLAYFHEDTKWITFHATDKTTIEEVDVSGVITCDTFEEYELLINKELTL